MAVKVALVVHVLAVTAILAFLEASSYRTSITTVAIQDNGSCQPLLWGRFCFPDGLRDNPREQCDRQISILQLNHCQMRLTTSFDYMMAVENPKQQEHLNLCCKQLQQVQEQCQCEAVRQVAKQALKQLQQQPGGQKRIMAEQVVKTAQTLPNKCNLKCSI
uniref:PawS1b n=1 Tax=Zinnia haageana TaxID=1525732 RepID=A0A0A0UXX4_9ASTR|nr:PawS1b precursor [Zinnia haageana]